MMTKEMTQRETMTIEQVVERPSGADALIGASPIFIVDDLDSPIAVLGAKHHAGCPPRPVRLPGTVV